MDVPSPNPPPARFDCGVAVLRPWRNDDLDDLVAAVNDESVSPGVRKRFPYPYSGDDGRAWLVRAIGEPDRGWALEIDGHVAGGIGLEPCPGPHRRSAEIGYWLAQRFWNRGVMTKVLSAFVPHVMHAFDLEHLYASVYEGNPASAHVLGKCGFVLEGVQESGVAENGRWLEIHRYACRRSNVENDG